MHPFIGRKAKVPLRARFKKDKSSILITNPVTSFRYVETIRKLASRTANMLQERNAVSLLITSITENEGKTTIAANLALGMAEEGNRVFADRRGLRKLALYKVLNMKEAEFTGLSEYLLHDTDSISRKSIVPDCARNDAGLHPE